MRSLIFPTLDDLLANRGLLRRDDGVGFDDAHDYGAWWRDHRDGVFRLTWLGPRGWRDNPSADPGELFLLRLGAGEGREAELLCVIAPADEEPYDRVVEVVLDGWADVCGAEGSVDWVRQRAREAVAAGRALPVEPITVGSVQEVPGG
jgi:hypothetical protein